MNIYILLDICKQSLTALTELNAVDPGRIPSVDPGRIPCIVKAGRAFSLTFPVNSSLNNLNVVIL